MRYKESHEIHKKRICVYILSEHLQLHFHLPDARIVKLSCFWNEWIFSFGCNKFHSDSRRFAVGLAESAKMQMRLWTKPTLARIANDLASLDDVSDLNLK